jgi:stress response protein YsnF
MSESRKGDSSVHTMPLVAEDYSVSKKNVQSDVVIEKRWVTRVETFRVPVRYQELYVNGKALKPSKADSLVSAVRNTVKGPNSKKKAVPVPLIDGRRATEKIIPLFGERVSFSKKMAHTNDIAIRKQKVTQVKRVKVSTISETAKAKYPSGRIEKLA